MPKLLDLFCGAGGSAVGYHRAGFTEIVGVDHRPMPRYPFQFVKADALDFCASFGAGFDVIHASPPCQHYVAFNRGWTRTMGIARDHPDLVPLTRHALQRAGRPYVMENVPTAPLHHVTAVICGSAFGLRVRRHRLFESSELLQGTLCRHAEQGPPIGVYGHGGPKNPGGRGRRYKTREEASHALGIDWMTIRELVEAIPPAYTEFIGKQLLEAIR